MSGWQHGPAVPSEYLGILQCVCVHAHVPMCLMCLHGQAGIKVLTLCTTEWMDDFLKGGWENWYISEKGIRLEKACVVITHLLMIPLLGDLHEDSLPSGNQQARKHSLIELKVGRERKENLSPQSNWNSGLHFPNNCVIWGMRVGMEKAKSILQLHFSEVTVKSHRQSVIYASLRHNVLIHCMQ